MLSEEEKKAIENLKYKLSQDDDSWYYEEEIDTVLNLLAKLQKENEKYKYLYQKALDNTIKSDRKNIELKKQIEALKEEVREENLQKLEDYYNEG